jgi:cytochrome c-type biogenesis protein CcmF
VFVGGALALFAWRAPMLKPGGLFAPVSRESALVVNNLLLAAATGAVFIGTLYPLAYEAVSGAKISVGPPYFNMTFGPLVAVLLLLVPIGPMLAWKRADAWGAVQRLWTAALIAAGVGLAVLVVHWRGPWIAPFGIALGVWLIAGSLVEKAERIQLFKVPLASSWARLKGLPRSAFGTTLAHMGVGILVIGVISVTAWRHEVVAVMTPGSTIELAGRSVTFLGESPFTGPNYTAEVARFRIDSGGREVATITSDKRTYLPDGQSTTQVGIEPFLTGDLYLAIGDRADGGRVLRAYFHPFVHLIWLGSAIMFLGGAVSLSDRRLRVGAPTRAPARAPATQPAE